MTALQAWTRDDRAEEARILSRLESANTERTTTGAVFSTESGRHFDLSLSLSQIIEEARTLSHLDRQELIQQYVDLRMKVLGSDLQALAVLRNRVAKNAGYSDYWELTLAEHGLTSADVDAVVAELEAAVHPYQQIIQLRRALVSERTGLPISLSNLDLIDHHAGDPYAELSAGRYFDGDLAEERIRLAFSEMGYTSSNWDVHIGPSRYVRPGAYAFAIHPPERVSIVMSSDRQMSIWPYEALAHEGGLATWWQNLDEESAASPVLWQPTAPWFEGYGGFFERLVYEPSFTARYVPDLDESMRQTLRDSRVHDTIDTITYHLVQVAAEKALYSDPSSLEAICATASARRQALTHNPANPTSEDGLIYEPALLSAILWNYPGYSANFLFAHIVEAWVFEAASDAHEGNLVGNGSLATYLSKNLVQASPGLSVTERLSAMYTTERAAPLVQYLASAPPLPEPPTDLPWLGTPDTKPTSEKSDEATVTGAP
jgi:hypothetical protein